MSSERQAFNDGFDKGYAKAQDKIAQLEAEVEKWEKIANEEHAQSAHIAMRNGELEAENEGLKEKIEILKMIVLESPEAIRLVRGVLDEIDTTNKK